MKSLYSIGLILAILAHSLSGFSQNNPSLQRRTAPQRTQGAASDDALGLTERARIKNEEASKPPAHIVWLREMYRFIDLDKDNNAALYHPVQPVGDRMNLFTTLFKLLADGKINAYNYLLDEREVFTDAEKLNFEEFLKTYQIPYQIQGSGNNIRYIVDDYDIPSYEVLMYYIKEGHYFDAATGTFASRVIAICPLLIRTDFNIGDRTTNPLFWIPYEYLRPYLSRAMIMTSNYNNVMTYSIDDFFTKGMYDGDIAKTVNLRNQSLAQQVGNDPEALQLAQDSIENQLRAFRTQLWVQPDTTQVAANNRNVRRAPARTETTRQERSSSTTSATPTRSVRRTR